MIVRKSVGTVGTLAHEAVSTAVSVAKHPIGSTALAAGMVKGVAGAGINLVRGVVSGASPTPSSDTPPTETPGESLDVDAEGPPTETADATEVNDASDVTDVTDVTEVTEAEVSEDPRDELPGPDLAAFEPPRPEDLPEPIVIEADDAPVDGESGEPFHTEPKAASRASEHGGPAGDREEVDGYAEEIPTSEVDIETPVGTTGADVAFNPDTAEADLQQPQTPEVLDPGVASAVESETEILRKAADPRPE